MGLKHLFEKIEPHFTHGKLRKYYPLYEATATIFYTPGLVTKGAAHVRDAIGLVCGFRGYVLGYVQRWSADHSGAASFI